MTCLLLTVPECFTEASVYTARGKGKGPGLMSLFMLGGGGGGYNQRNKV